MTVCVVGAGAASEHALAHVLASATTMSSLRLATPASTGISANGHRPSLRHQAAAEEIDADLYVIGPEAPLVEGLADRLRAMGKRVFGPSADGARLRGIQSLYEGPRRKRRCADRSLLHRRGTWTRRHAFFATLSGGYVIKTRWPGQAGKGVFVTTSLDEALADVTGQTAEELAFGDAGRRGDRRGIVGTGGLALGALRRRTVRCAARLPRTSKCGSAMVTLA